MNDKEKAEAIETILKLMTSGESNSDCSALVSVYEIKKTFRKSNSRVCSDTFSKYRNWFQWSPDPFRTHPFHPFYIISIASAFSLSIMPLFSRIVSMQIF